MQTRKRYSPQLERGFVHLLYLEARKRHVPMTRLANELIGAALRRREVAAAPPG